MSQVNSQPAEKDAPLPTTTKGWVELVLKDMLASGSWHSPTLVRVLELVNTIKDVDRSDAADAKRFRCLLDGNGYFFEENGLCGHPPVDDKEKDQARVAVDELIEYFEGKKS